MASLGNAYADLDDSQRAIEFYRQALDIFRDIGDPRGEGNCLWDWADELDTLGLRDRAIPLARRALAIFRQIEDPNAAKVEWKLAEWAKPDRPADGG